VAVGKAIGIAVVRNRVKRRLRELFRRRKALLPQSYDLFVRALPASACASYRMLDEAWCQGLALLTAAPASAEAEAKQR
jgi:ribonuclease P protein component